MKNEIKTLRILAMLKACKVESYDIQQFVHILLDKALAMDLSVDKSNFTAIEIDDCGYINVHFNTYQGGNEYSDDYVSITPEDLQKNVSELKDFYQKKRDEEAILKKQKEEQDRLAKTQRTEKEERELLVKLKAKYEPTVGDIMNNIL